MENENEGNIDIPRNNNQSNEPENGTSYFAIGIVVVILVIAGGFYLMQGQNQEIKDELPIENDTGISAETITEDNTNIPISTEIDYTNNGFTPKEITVNTGTTVIFTNSSDNSMWVASAMHPTHEVYAGTTLSQHCGDTEDVSFDQCRSGESYSFTFDKAGTWGYHNHMNSSDFGKIIVK